MTATEEKYKAQNELSFCGLMTQYPNLEPFPSYSRLLGCDLLASRDMRYYMTLLTGNKVINR